MFNKIMLSSAILLLLANCAGIKESSMMSSDKRASYTQEMYDNVDTTFFAFDSSAVSKEDQNKLDFQIDRLNKNKDMKILVVGNADARGTREYNIALGERRANAVKSYLTSQGIDSERIRVDSMGKEALRCDTNNPIYQVISGDKDVYHKQNRRSVIYTDDSVIDHNRIVEQESKRCQTSYNAVQFFSNVLSNDLTNDDNSQEEDVVFMDEEACDICDN